MAQITSLKLNCVSLKLVNLKISSLFILFSYLRSNNVSSTDNWPKPISLHYICVLFIAHKKKTKWELNSPARRTMLWFCLFTKLYTLRKRSNFIWKYNICHKNLSQRMLMCVLSLLRNHFLQKNWMHISIGEKKPHNLSKSVVIWFDKSRAFFFSIYTSWHHSRLSYADYISIHDTFKINARACKFKELYSYVHRCHHKLC